MAKKIKDIDATTTEQAEAKAERRMTFRASEAFTKDAHALAERLGISTLRVRAIVDAKVQEYVGTLDVKALVRDAMFGDE